MDKKTVIISGFPGVGKTHFHTMMEKELAVLDSDSSKFDKSDFPANYIRHIKENIGKADVILVSSHDTVRNALVDAGIRFNLVYPKLNDKELYIMRYIKRGSPEKFIDLISQNWDAWINELLQEKPNKFAMHWVLQGGNTLTDLFMAHGNMFRTAYPEEKEVRTLTFTETTHDDDTISYSMETGGFTYLELAGIAEQIKIFRFQHIKG